MSKCPNGSVPLLLSWKSSTIAVAGAVLSRGIDFGIGTPPQPFALTPSTSSNNLFLNNVAECGGVKNVSCIVEVGGVFDSSTSTSFANVDYANWGGSRDGIDLASRGSYVFFEDAISFGSTPTTNKFPLYPIFMNGSIDTAVTAMDTEPMTGATLPLGPNSTFLNFLVDSGQASSRTYGLWAGSESGGAPQDGLVIVGGYDTSRLKSPASTFPMFSGCPTCVIVTAITYDKGGTSTTLFDNATETLMVNLDPFVSTMELPTNLLQNLAGAESDATWNGTLNRFTFPAGATLPGGTITVTLSSANAPLGDASKQTVASYKTVIPATELFHRPRVFSATGVLETFDPTIYELAVTNRTSRQVATLGLPFFTQNYLIVDPDAQNFQLAPAVATPADAKAATVSTVCRPEPKGSGKSYGIGALAGAIAGSIIGTALICGLALWFRRRKAASTSRDSQASTAVASSHYERMESGKAPARSARDSSGESKTLSMQLPLQRPPSLQQSPPPRVRGSMQTVGSDDPRRDLNRAIYQDIDDRNDGRLLDERPTGLHETIHSRSTLPRVAAEHEI